MTTRFLTFVVSLLLFTSTSFTQTDPAFSSPEINDEMTLNPEQNAQWRNGQSKFSAKPKNMWELGLRLGNPFISGDVATTAFSGVGFGAHLRKAFNYALSVRIDAFYSINKGYDPRPISSSSLAAEKLYKQSGGISGPLGGYVTGNQKVHRNYKNGLFAGSFQLVLNIGNVLFHKERNKWNLYTGLGIGLNVPNVASDLLDGNSLYNFNSVSQGLDLTSKDDRKESRKRLKDLLDGDYETDGGVEDQVSALGDKKEIIPHLLATFGLSRKLSSNINIGIEHQVLFSDNDLLDGFENRSGNLKSTSNDIHQMTSIVVGINIGNSEKRAEPLYWLNPLDAPMNDLAELKQRPKFDLTDSDGDGIIDMIDQEPNSPAGAAVDTRGVALDSDNDGILDYKDKEPYSAPGFDVDRDGVAKVPDLPYLTEDEIVELINARTSNIKTDWFLPMVHFDLDKYFIKPEFYGQLHHVASVMKMHPNIKVAAVGFSDNRNTPGYNDVLSFKRAEAAINYIVSQYDIPRERFILLYGGEQGVLIGDLPDHHRTTRVQEMQHYMNRRVEFRIALGDDADMPMPVGPDAGASTPNSSRPGSKYSGNKNSGYRP